MKTKIILFVVCLIFGTILLSSCDGDDNSNGNSYNSIVGTWVYETQDTYSIDYDGKEIKTGTIDAAYVWQFTSDNSWIYTHEYYINKGSDAEKYFGKSGTIIENYYGEGKTGKYQFKNTSGEGILTLYAPDGSIATLGNELAEFQCSVSGNVMYIKSKDGKNSAQFTRTSGGGDDNECSSSDNIASLLTTGAWAYATYDETDKCIFSSYFTPNSNSNLPTSYSDVFIFRSDGTFTETRLTKTYNGTYTLDGNKLTLTIYSNNATMSITCYTDKIIVKGKSVTCIRSVEKTEYINTETRREPSMSVMFLQVQSDWVFRTYN